MYVGEGQDQLHALAKQLEERAGGLAGVKVRRLRGGAAAASRGYYRGLAAGLLMAARAARKEATRLLRAQRKAFAKNID